MTTRNMIDIADNERDCPSENLLKMMSGKWKSQIFRMAIDKPVRFSSLLRELKGSNKQAVSLALRELESAGLLAKNIVKTKPLHIEYAITEKGRSVVSVFKQLDSIVLDANN